MGPFGCQFAFLILSAALVAGYKSDYDRRDVTQPHMRRGNAPLKRDQRSMLPTPEELDFLMDHPPASYRSESHDEDWEPIAQIRTASAISRDDKYDPRHLRSSCVEKSGKQF